MLKCAVSDSRSNKRNNLNHLLQIIAEVSGAGFPWLDISAEIWRRCRRLWQRLTDVGIYEVLSHEATLEIKDSKGHKAHLHKRQQVRYLQNNVIAYRDQAWGDGDALLNYCCSPGIEVDRYKPAHTTYIVISLRETKQRGDIDEYDIQWDAKDAFTRSREAWVTEISHRTTQIKLQIIFPTGRPPHNIKMTERYRNRVHEIDRANYQQMADGRWLISWQMQHPRINERFLFEWDW